MKKIFIFILIFQFLVQPILPSFRVFDEEVIPRALADEKKDFVEVLNQSSESSPPPASPDIFKLNQQEYYLEEDTSFDFDTDLKLVSSPNESKFTFIIESNNNELGRHTFYGHKLLSFARDKERLQWINADGSVYAIDMTYSRSAVFRKKIIVSRITKLPEDLVSEIAKNPEQIKVQFYRREILPITTVHPQALAPLDTEWKAGDFIVLREKNSSSREAIAVLSRAVTDVQMSRDYEIAALEAYILNPETAGKKEAQELLTRSEGLNLRARALRDRFSHKEHLQITQDQENKKNEVTEPERSGLFKYLKRNALKWIGLITAGSAAAIGLDSLADGYGPAWAVYWVQSAYENYWPDVLKNAAYRVTLFKSYLSLASFLPVMLGVAALVGKFKKWDFQKTVAILGIRSFAVLQSLHIEIINWFQPNYLKAIKAGLKPSQMITKNSELGKTLGLIEDVKLGVSSLLLSRKERKFDIQQKESLIQQVEKLNTKAHAYHAIQINKRVAGSFGLDPVTLLMAQMNQLNFENSDEFLGEWDRRALEIQRLIHSIESESQEADLLPLDIAEEKRLTKIAEFSAKNIRHSRCDGSCAKSSEVVNKMLDHLKLRWAKLSPSLSPGGWLKKLSNHNEEESEFLKNFNPTPFVSSSSLRIISIDYLSTVGQLGLIGERADPSQPLNLAADPNGPLWTHPSHLSDMSEDFVWFTMSFPAMIAQSFGDEQKHIVEDAYDPIEKITHKSVIKPESFLASFKNWLSGALQVEKADLGGYVLKGINKKMHTLYATALLFGLFRYFIADQAFFSQIAPSFIYMLLWGMWQYEYIYQVVNRLNQIYVEDLEQLIERFDRAKALLSQGLRLNKKELMKEGVDELTKIFLEKNSKLPKHLSRVIKNAETLMELSPSEMQKDDKQLRSHLGAVVMLSKAIDSGDREFLKSAYSNLRAQYSESSGFPVSNFPQKISFENQARALLDYSVKHPLFPNKRSPLVLLTTTFIGSVSSTYLAAPMLVLTSLTDVPWLTKILEAGVWSAVLYAGVHYGQKMLNRFERWFRGKPSKAKINSECQQLLHHAF